MKNQEAAQQTIPGVAPAPSPPAPGVELEDLLTVARVAHEVAFELRRAGVSVFRVQTCLYPLRADWTAKAVQFSVYDEAFVDQGRSVVVSFFKSIGGGPGAWYGPEDKRQRNWCVKLRGVSVGWIESEGAGR